MIFENVRKRCKARGVSINAVEAAAGIGKNVIYKWQKSQPSLKSLKAVADYFGCALDDLTREETEQPV